MRLLAVVVSLVSGAAGASVALEAVQSSGSAGTTTCVGQRLWYSPEVRQIGPSTRLLDLTVAPTLPQGFDPNFTLKADGDSFVITVEVCPGTDCEEFCLYALGCGSRVSLYPCPFNFFGGRDSTSLWKISEVEASSGPPLYQITNVGCPSMKLQVWEPNTEVMECLFEEDDDCVWTVSQQRACQLPFPADLDGTSCNSGPARSLVSESVFPGLTDVQSSPALCEPVAGSSPLDLWELHGLDSLDDVASWAIDRTHVNSVILLLFAAVNI